MIGSPNLWMYNGIWNHWKVHSLSMKFHMQVNRNQFMILQICDVCRYMLLQI